MMYKKAELFNDFISMVKILQTSDPYVQKKLGRNVQGFKQQLWDKHKFEIVVNGNRLKFNQHNDLKEMLLLTKNLVIVEASPYDRIWGIGIGITDPKRFDEIYWKGENLLGKALMVVRNELKEDGILIKNLKE